MEFHQLRYFVAVADEGSFSRAAAREHVAQPSLSQQVQKLECELGQPLFDRLPRGVVLTRAGEQLVSHARRILAEVADARRTLSADGIHLTGTVSAGVIPTIAPFLVPRITEILLRRHPGMSIEVYEETTGALIRRLQVGELDVAIVSTVHPTPSIQVEAVAVEPLVVLLPASSRCAVRPSLSWRDLRNEKFLVLHEMHCLSGQVSQLCERQRLQPQIVFRGAQLETVARMVTAGVGCSIVPAMMAASDSSPERVYRPLRNPQPTRPLCLAWNLHRHRPPQAMAVAEVVRKVVGSPGGALDVVS